MNATNFQKLLLDLGACSKARKWAKGKSLSKVWETCEHGDWLLWLCGKMVDKPNWPTRQQVVLAACVCAETALQYVPVDETRPRKAIETARSWVKGEATIEQVRTAAYAAADAAADATYAAAYAAAYAANTAADAANTAAYATYAAAAAAYAADAAAYATNTAADAALRNCADIVRQIIPMPEDK
jgi:hypothetical protein